MIRFLTKTSRIQDHFPDPGVARKAAPVFSFDLKIVAPSFTIVYRCRDLAIRPRAIALRYDAPRQEGLRQSIITASVCKRLVRVEEAGLSEVVRSDQIPESNRIDEIEMPFDMQELKGYLRLCRRKDNGEQLNILKPVVELIQEVDEW